MLYFWQKLEQREVPLTKMFTLFGSSHKVSKPNFWAACEKIGANFTKADLDTVFSVFDRTGKK